MSSFEKSESTAPQVQEVDTSFVDLVEGNFDKGVEAPESESETASADDMEALADELFGTAEGALQSPDVAVELAERIKEAYKGGEAQVMSEVTDGVTPEEIVSLSKEEAKAIQEAVNAGEIAVAYVSDLPKEWDKPKSLSATDVEGFKTALTQRELANEQSQKKILKTGFATGTTTFLGGFGATLAGVGTGGIIMASGGGFLILGGLGYAGKKIFDKYQEKKAIKGFAEAHTTATKSPEKKNFIMNYLSKRG